MLMAPSVSNRVLSPLSRIKFRVPVEILTAI
jgi:hypothetical protein